MTRLLGRTGCAPARVTHYTSLVTLTSPAMPPVPSERALFSTYKLWRKYADPDGLISASEFAEMDDDDKREALRELGGVQPVAAGAVEPGDEADEDDDEDGLGAQHEEEELPHDRH